MKVRELVSGMLGKFGLDYSAAIIGQPRCFLHICLVVFDTKDEAQTKRAYDASKALVAEAAKHGYGEYRAHLDFMDLALEQYDFNNHALRRFNETAEGRARSERHSLARQAGDLAEVDAGNRRRPAFLNPPHGRGRHRSGRRARRDRGVPRSGRTVRRRSSSPVRRASARRSFGRRASRRPRAASSAFCRVGASRPRPRSSFAGLSDLLADVARRRGAVTRTARGGARSRSRSCSPSRATRLPIRAAIGLAFLDAIRVLARAGTRARRARRRPMARLIVGRRAPDRAPAPARRAGRPVFATLRQGRTSKRRSSSHAPFRKTQLTSDLASLR